MMQKHEWLPMVLIDIERYCRKNNLSEIEIHLKEARLQFDLINLKNNLFSDNGESDFRLANLLELDKPSQSVTAKQD